MKKNTITFNIYYQNMYKEKGHLLISAHGYFRRETEG